MSRVAITADLDAVVEFDSVTMRMPRRRCRKGAVESATLPHRGRGAT